jgi:5'-3' exonuclease
MLKASNGFPTGVIYGVLAGMLRLHRYYPKAAMVFCWDGGETDKSWRHILAKTYKERRRDKRGEKPQEVKDVYVQIPQLKILLGVMGFLQIEIPKLEADDMIGILSHTLTNKKGIDKVYIYSSDKDFVQLMSSRVKLIRDSKKEKAKKCVPLTRKKFKKEFGIDASDWNNYRALVGEKTDDIRKPLPKGIGPKTALAMLASGCDPSSDKCTVDKLKDCWKDVRLNYKLVKIVKRLDDKRLPTDVRKQVKQILDQIQSVSSDKLYRSKQGISREGYRAMVKLLGKYELSLLLEARRDLLKIP